MKDKYADKEIRRLTKATQEAVKYIINDRIPQYRRDKWDEIKLMQMIDQAAKDLFKKHNVKQRDLKQAIKAVLSTDCQNRRIMRFAGIYNDVIGYMKFADWTSAFLAGQCYADEMSSTDVYDAIYDVMRGVDQCRV